MFGNPSIFPHFDHFLHLRPNRLTKTFEIWTQRISWPSDENTCLRLTLRSTGRHGAQAKTAGTHHLCVETQSEFQDVLMVNATPESLFKYLH